MTIAISVKPILNTSCQNYSAYQSLVLGSSEIQMKRDYLEPAVLALDESVVQMSVLQSLQESIPETWSQKFHILQKY